MGTLNGKHLITLEGLNQEEITPIQKAFLEYGASQCGFCTPGIILSLTGFFLNSENLDFQDAIDVLDGNICRCTGYVSIRNAVKSLTNEFYKKLDNNKNRLNLLIEWKILPGYFKDISKKLRKFKAEVLSESENFSWDYLIAVGTDLYVRNPEKFYNKNISLLNEIHDGNEIKEDNRFIYIDANVTIDMFEKSPILDKYLPELKKFLKQVSAKSLKNISTLTGNIVNASPIGDISIILLALKARLVIKNYSTNTLRELPLRKFYKGYKIIDLKKEEIITKIKIPKTKQPQFFNFEKVSQRQYFDIASVNTACLLKFDKDKIAEANFSAGGVYEYPKFLDKASTFLVGKKVDTNVLTECLNLLQIEISPISDIRGSIDYKRNLFKNLFLSHFIKAFPTLKDNLVKLV